MRIYQSEVLPEPKSMLEVDRVYRSLCAAVYVIRSGCVEIEHVSL